MLYISTFVRSRLYIGFALLFLTNRATKADINIGTILQVAGKYEEADLQNLFCTFYISGNRKIS